MKKFLLSLMFLGMLCGISSADIVYSTSNGKIGLIKISSNASGDVVTFDGVKYSGSATNPFLTSYRDKDDVNYVLLINRLTSGDTVQRFTYNNLSSPFDPEAISLTDVTGTTAAAFSANGRSLYFATPSKLFDVSTETMTINRYYDCTPEDSKDISPEIKGVAVSGTRIFALVDSQTESNDALLVFDGQLKTNVKAFARWEGHNDMTSMVWISNGRLAFTRSSGVDLLSGSTFNEVVSTDYPVITLQSDTGEGFLYATQYQSDDVYIDTLTHYSAGAESEFSTVTVNASNSNLKLLRDDKILAAIMGDEIQFYNIEKGTLIKTFTSSVLGGNPVNMTTAYVGGTSDTSSKSSGCEVGSVGAIALMILGMTLKRNRK